MSKITIYKDELHQILAVLDKFPDVERLELDCYSGAIGNTLNISFPYEVNGVATKQTVEISGVDKW